MFYISNDRSIFTVLINTSTSENNTEFKIWYAKKVIFNLYFSIVHISAKNVLGNLKCCMHLDNIPIEGTVSQIFLFKS